MDILRISAFSDGDTGGNPAGVVLASTMPDEAAMQQIAAEVGYSETVFAAPLDGVNKWRVRYFSPESEVPFCGHATIALGAALAETHGAGRFGLSLNAAEITVEGMLRDGRYAAVLQSPPTRSGRVGPEALTRVLALFGYRPDQLDGKIPPALINAGAEHMVLALNDREDLAAMRYELDAGRICMKELGLVTIMLVWRETDRLFHVRNAFASGGIFEDPATGAAAAAFAGYLRDIDWPQAGELEIVQGEDMGARSLIGVKLTNEVGSSVRVSGATRKIVTAGT